MQLDERFFRRESARLLATLTRAFGVANLPLVEDVVQDVLAHAFEAWKHQGVPPHHAAKLTTAAKNRAIDAFRRQRTARRFASDVQRVVEEDWTGHPNVDELFVPEATRDDELRVMFSCCHRRADPDVQVALILNMLCGFSAAEIASAFFVGEAAVHKRLIRGKKALAESHRLFELTSADFAPRLQAVQRALYVLFSEGYHSARGDVVVRRDLCQEAMRLTRLLLDHEAAATPATRALAALMCFDAARLPTRVDDDGELTPLADQPRARWDAGLIAEGARLLDESATGTELTAYHLEARIAALHTTAPSASETCWSEIVELYDLLVRMNPSPVVALNRAIALARLEGPARGLAAIAAIPDAERLHAYPFYPAALAELELGSGDSARALAHFRAAHALARNDAERHFLERRIAAAESCPAPSPSNVDTVLCNSTTKSP